MPRPIYVETQVRVPMEQLWQHTQDPAQHRRWDLRFSDITPLPSSMGGPDRFTYTTRVLPFVTVRGTGIHAGERHRADGGCTSALRFASRHPLSLIQEGSGYWRYLPDPRGIRFITGYDYRTRWGVLGRLLDRVLFRPLMGWATAWSFDRLRIWLELGVPPEVSRNRALADLAFRVAAVLAAAFIHPLAALAVGVMVLVQPPRPSAPAARRCSRRPSTPIRGPRVAAVLTAQETR